MRVDFLSFEAHSEIMQRPAKGFIKTDQDQEFCWITLIPGMAAQTLLIKREGTQEVDRFITKETPNSYS